MPERVALSGLRQALAAIDVMIRSGKGQGGRLVEMAREARVAADQLSRQGSSAGSAPRPAGVRPDKA